MPQNHRYSQKLGRWIKKETTKAFDYDLMDKKSAGLLISFFRWYPDYFLDIIRSPNASYKLELPQRLMLRIEARYRNSYITGSRGLTKTYITVLSKMIDGVLYPGEKIRYTAPGQKQAATLASQAFNQIEKDYPILAKCWKVANNRGDLFKIQTDYGSEFTMYAPRGDNCSQTIAEEIGEEDTAQPFDMDEYEQKILPTCRLVRKVNQKIDTSHINLKHAHISNACSRLNPAYTKHRAIALAQAAKGKPYEGFVIDIPWEVSLLCNIRDIAYVSDLKVRLSVEKWQREMCALYIGTNENPLISEELLSGSRKLKVMEDCHCGDPQAIYIVSHDVSQEEGAKNAKIGEVVLKLTRFDSVQKRDKYRKQVVYVNGFPPQPTGYEQGQDLKELWRRYCLDGGETTYLVVDSRSYGKGIVEELMKPSGDGSLPLCCYKHMAYTHIEQRGALPVIYPIKANQGENAQDNESEMISYARREFEQGNIELLTSDMTGGIEQYKRRHGIKDDFADRQISSPYKKTDELCEQISNLMVKPSGAGNKEVRRSKSIQRDTWSALKYALKMAYILEQELSMENNHADSSYEKERAKFRNGGGRGYSVTATRNMPQVGSRLDLLRLRKR